MNRSAVAVLFLVPSLLAAQQVTFTSMPRQDQLFARDAADSSAVAVAGTVTSTGFDSVGVTVYKNGAACMHLSQTLAYASGGAAFSLAPKIHAELANYKFELRVNTVLVASVDSVVCGDAYFIEGQSNAVAFNTWSYTNPWIRSFGNTWPATDAANLGVVVADTAFGVAQCNAFNYNYQPAQCHCAIGVWGMLIASQIVQSYGVPVCVINAAVGGTYITDHFRNTALGSIYGAALYRITKAGLKNGLKAIWWHQGETDGTDSAGHAVKYKTNFFTLYNSWKADYPSVQRIYLFQLRPANCSNPAENIVAELQREIPQGHSDIAAMSTVAASGYWDCHYGPDGYQNIGGYLYPLIAHDFYGATDTVNAKAPNILSVSFTDATHTKLLFQFDQPIVQPQDTMKRYFALDGVWDLAGSIQTDTANHTVTLVLKAASNAKTVNYVPGGYNPFAPTVVYDGPFLLNPRGIGAFTFCNFPITGPTPIAPRRAAALPGSISLTVAAPAVGRAVTIAYATAAASLVRIAAYATNGARVRTLLAKSIGPGSYRQVWDRRDDAGSPLAPGLYLIRLESDGAALQNRVMLSW